MSLVIISPTRSLTPWVSALQKEDPSVEIVFHHQPHDQQQVEFALAWDHPPGIFSDYPNLKCISSMGAGVDHLLSDPAIPSHIPVVRIIDPKLSQDIFEFALAVIMNRLRGLTQYRLNQTRSYWKKQPYLNIAAVRVGVMGTGVIGHHAATRLQQIGFSVQGWSRTPGQQTSYRKFAGPEQLADFLEQTDILICLLPLTPATQGILNHNNLLKLPRGSWLVNLGRGGHLVDHDLMQVLESGHLQGANLDVFEQEPLPAGHPFWSHPQINITPHIASLTTPGSVAPQIVDNYYRARQNRPLLNVVDRSRGY